MGFLAEGFRMKAEGVIVPISIFFQHSCFNVQSGGKRMQSKLSGDWVEMQSGCLIWDVSSSATTRFPKKSAVVWKVFTDKLHKCSWIMQLIIMLSLFYYILLLSPVIQNGAKMHPAAVKRGSVSFWYLYHPCDEIMQTVSLILLHMNAGMHRYTHAEQQWRMSSRSTTSHLGLICLKLCVCWTEPSPSLSIGDDDPQARQTSVTTPPLRVLENDLLSF